MKKLSHWFKILVINIILVFCLIIFLEISAGLGRLVLGKPFLPFFNPYPYGAKGLKLSLYLTLRFKFFCILSDLGSAKIDLPPKALGPNSILP